VKDVAEGKADGLPLRSSGEFAFPIIASTLTGCNDLIPAVNIRNDGLIGNLPDWAVVEVPAVAAVDRVCGVRVGEENLSCKCDSAVTCGRVI
jgi:alpha-galactosidase/6-phospho-beta-glucosidase family protein